MSFYNISQVSVGEIGNLYKIRMSRQDSENWEAWHLQEVIVDIKQQPVDMIQATKDQDTIGRGARCSSVVRSLAHGAMGHRIDPSWGGPIELFLVPASAPRLV